MGCASASAPLVANLGGGCAGFPGPDAVREVKVGLCWPSAEQLNPKTEQGGPSQRVWGLGRLPGRVAVVRSSGCEDHSQLPAGGVGSGTAGSALVPPQRPLSPLRQTQTCMHAYARTHTCTCTHSSLTAGDSLPLRSSEPCRHPVCPHLNPQCSDSTGDKCYPLPTRIQQPRGPSSRPGPSFSSRTNGGPAGGSGQGYLEDGHHGPVSGSQA